MGIFHCIATILLSFVESFRSRSAYFRSRGIPMSLPVTWYFRSRGSTSLLLREGGATGPELWFFHYFYRQKIVRKQSIYLNQRCDKRVLFSVLTNAQRK